MADKRPEKRQPWLKWFPQAWRADVPLRMCSYAARGLWADLLTLMAESETFGFLLINSKAPSPKQLAALLGGSEREINTLLNELNEASVYSVTGNPMPVDIEALVPKDMPAGVILSRRMLRDKTKADKDRENGRGGGNPSLRQPHKERVNPTDKAQKIEVRGEAPSGLPPSQVETPSPVAARVGLEGPARDGTPAIEAISVGNVAASLDANLAKGANASDDDLALPPFLRRTAGAQMTGMPELPHNFEAEQALLGAILVNNHAYHQVADFLRAEHFADPLHGELFEAVSKLLSRGQSVNVITFKAYIEQNAALREAGGAAYLARMAASSVHMFDAAVFGRIVVEAAARRRLIGLAEEARAAAYAPLSGETATDQVERLERALYDIASDQVEGGFQNSNQIIAKTLRTAEGAYQRAGKLAGISTGFKSLDRLLGGLHKSDLIILAGRPSMGKTALATNIAVDSARTHSTEDDGRGGRRTIEGAVVGFCSLEMSAEQLMTRIIAERAGVPSERVRRGELTKVEVQRLIDAGTALQGLPLYIDETPALSLAGLRSRARRQQRQYGLGLIVVDYLQLMHSDRTDGRVQEVSEISRGLKALAKEINVPVLALSQLSRGVENRTDKRPLLSDLRDSGTIEQDADVVMFIYREEYYLERGGGRDRLKEVQGLTELHIAKHRHGPTGVVPLSFDGATMTFKDQTARGQE
jgi:replicative DNA helicase